LRFTRRCWKILNKLRGKSFKVEVKNSEKDALNPNQQQFKRRYESAGGKVFVVWDLEIFQTDFKIWVCKF